MTTKHSRVWFTPCPPCFALRFSSFKARAASPADIERRGIFFAALGAANRRAGGRGTEEGGDEIARARLVGGILDPELRQRGLDGQLARDARGVRVEDAHAHAARGEQVGEELRFGQVGGGEDALQKRYDTNALTPSSLTPERPDT